MATTSRLVRNLLSRARASVLALPLLAPIGLGALHPEPARAQDTGRFSSIVVEAASGKVLQQFDPDALRHPASLAKLMTLYMTFEALRDRRITLDTLVPVSAHAASMQPTKLGLVPGMRVTVQQAILGLVTKSANDAAAALGELLGGSEDRFAQMMTLRARALGMAHTTFANASGLPDPDEWTSARDMAVLARHLIYDFPNDYHYFSTPNFVFHGVTIFNHDTMLKAYPGVDGMKTGFTDASGHNLVTSAMRGGVRLIGVELGANSNGQRDMRMTAMLNMGYEAMDVPIGPVRAARAASAFWLVGSAHAATIEHAAHVVSIEHAAHVVSIEHTTHVTTIEHVAHGVVRTRPELGSSTWAVQVGVYRNEKMARTAAFAAHRMTDRGEPRIEPIVARGRRIWRAQLAGLTPPEAQGACSILSHHRTPCIVLRPEVRELASR